MVTSQPSSLSVAANDLKTLCDNSKKGNDNQDYNATISWDPATRNHIKPPTVDSKEWKAALHRGRYISNVTDYPKINKRLFLNSILIYMIGWNGVSKVIKCFASLVT